MPDFFHERKDAKELIQTLAEKKSILPEIVEKDYWVMHCLWGLNENRLSYEMKGGTSLSKGWGVIDRFSEDIDVRFEPPSGLNTRGDKPAQVKARAAFFDELASKIKIPGVQAVRNTAFDDDRARNGGIGLSYRSYFSFDERSVLRPYVLLEAGFTRTAPNEPCDFSSWVFDEALRVKLDVIDNRARAVKCFNPEYTFVDKLQTICKRYRQYRAGDGADRNRPREFLRHYYDLCMLLRQDRVQRFTGTPDYEAYKKEKLRGADADEFATRKAFTLSEPETFELFEKEYRSVNTLLLSSGPSFKEIMATLREFSPKF